MYTFTTPQPLFTAHALKVTELDLDAASGNGIASYIAVDANGNPLPGGGGSYVIPGADVATLWPEGVGVSAALYTYLAGKLGWAAGTATAG